jgi:hypothetical protein
VTSSGTLAHQVADIFLEGINEKLEEKKEETEELDIDLNTLLYYVGDYELEPGFILAIQEKEGKLSVKPTGEKTYPLMALSTTEFKVGDVGFKVEFLPHTEGKTDSLLLYSGIKPKIAIRTAPFDTSTVNLSEFVGRYYSEELSTTYHFIVDGNILVAKHSRHPDIHFNPLKQDLFSGNTWFFGQAQFVRNERGNITGLNASSGRVRNIKFHKVE